MKFLLDAHTLIWCQDDPSQLGAAAAQSLRDRSNSLMIGAGTIWEISIKVGRAKLKLNKPFREWIDFALWDLELSVLSIEIDHMERQAILPPHHGDPFDRMLASQSLVLGVPVISKDAILDMYQVVRIWS